MVKAKISPNQATLMAFGVGLTVPLLYLSGNPLVAVTALWLSGYLDAVDGAIARQTKTASPLGTLLDILFDRVVEAMRLFRK